MSPAREDEVRPAEPQVPQTPRRLSNAKHGNATTPTNRRASAQAPATPKSAPASAGHGSSHKKKTEPSLLGDFFLGRPSPARVAAQRDAIKHRRKSMAADAADVREELRQEMRAAAVRRAQHPGGVTDRVKAWQETNAAAMKSLGGGIPHAEDVATEPTEVAARIAPESVTEEDRVRIKMRQKTKKKKKAKVEDKENQGDGNGEETEREKPAPPKANGAPRGPPVVVKLAPKKRIVSDDNWMKRRNRRNPPRDTSPKPKPKVEPAPTPLPKDFLQKTARNPTVQSKIKDWAQRVEIPEPAKPPPVQEYRHKKTGATVTVEEDAPDPSASSPEIKASPKHPVDQGIRAKPTKPRRPKTDANGGIRVTPVRKKQQPDDGIRVTPMKKQEQPDDGIRVRPIDTNIPDDGIRIRPMDSPVPKDDGIRVRPCHRTPEEVPVRPLSSRQTSVEPSSRTPSQPAVQSPGDVIEVIEDPETEVETPTKRKASRRRARRRSRSPSPVVPTAVPPVDQHQDTETAGPIPPQPCSDGESEMIPTLLGDKSLADIPFGYSAFSELDLPLGADARNSGTKRPKAQRNPSFKAVPKVLKKVVTGAKDIIQEMAEPPRPVVANQPRNIEAWLNDTVDPFVDSAPKEATAEGPVQGAPVQEKAPTPEPQEPAPVCQEQPSPQPTSDSRPRESVASSASKKTVPQDQQTTDSQAEDSDATPKNTKSPATPSTGLKRRRATRVVASPAKPGGRKPFRELLREAFRGESVGHKLPPTIYPSCEADDDTDRGYEEDDYESREGRRPSSEPTRGPASSDYSSTYYSSTYDSTLSSDLSSQGQPRKRPPTNGVHELSTIVSEESSSTIGSDAHSDVSQTTVTQTTAFTKSTEASRQKSQKTSLKRRLTKHSDLVSVLSLPDNGQLVPPSRSRSIKSSHSLHRRPSRANKSREDDLLDEFADDEHFYGRELKALVDGVIPVLLRDVVNGDARDAKADTTVKSVINMGMALEKLRDYHKRVPLSNLSELFVWLTDVSPVYDHYLDVWRLGFQGLIINLAPRHGRYDDDDSLLNALPLNEDGDIVGEDGERVDVAFLLKRPLIRVKWMVKFLKAAVAITEIQEAERLLSAFTGLQEKARKRHKEESARMMDEDANSTDTSRCRDLRNLLPLDGVSINRTRQVAALDVFSLDLRHSSGQRLECQVEMIFRDSPPFPEDKGDILVREIGNGARSYLLFPPVPRQYISARLSEGHDSLIVMIRGCHNGEDWFELLTLSTTNDEQIDYWLRVLGSHPMPPAIPRKPASMVQEAGSPRSGRTDVPVGERRPSSSSLESSDTKGPRTPSQYPPRQDGGFSSPEPPADVSSDRTPTRHDYAQDRTEEDERSPSWEHSSGDNIPKIVRPSPNTTPFREDGAPPPPIHRTLGPASPGLLSPPVDAGPHARIKRRMSSPLKHEYHPSDVSSDSASSVSDDDSELSDTSSDDLDEDEVPETMPGYSIKEPGVAPVESVVSENSITPSNSASQVELKDQDEPKSNGPLHKFAASVSYWSSRKGVWREINNGQPASIVIHPGCLEVHHAGEQHYNRQAYPLQSSGTSEVDNSNKDAGTIVPLVALILTPVVMIRRSNALDLEVRSPASPEARLKIEASMFRFRSTTPIEAKDLYEAVHISRLNNARYIQLSEEARVRSFGQMQAAPGEGSADGDSSSRQRSWFGRKNSYRASTRAPSVSQGSVSTTHSAGSFLRRLMGGGGNNNSYNIDESTLDKQQPGPGGASLYTSSSGSGLGSGSGSGSSTPPRSASISLSNSGSQSRWSYGLAKPFSPDEPLEIRCHLNVQNNRWLDKGDCVLRISRPPPGVRQELPLYHGLEKRVIVTHATKKAGGGDCPLILLDAVLGSKCFSLLGTKGVMCSVWEEVRDEEGNVGVVPRSGPVGGRVAKWCFQCKSVQQAACIMGMLTSEVPGLMMR
ncbi:hypothetical protein N658DRAFT_508063 [Parathielavia hyrcaniae]|uniref:Uncharacterized protein n=1 Tax=Parathielavia hyrcaniae TaxID=113614 RepID=A0AAN6T0T9_9PEZI|nr:hypothetical protein N658DRAFT_508063 [Parathielavia hyrcaniae]